MKSIFIIITSLLLFSCKKKESSQPDGISAQNITVSIQPQKTDANYSSTEKSHYVVNNNQLHLNKLLLFIGGSYSDPKDYNYVCDFGASIGLDVISLSYPNNVAAAPLGSSSDRLIFDNYRNEICFGNPVSDEVSVNLLNCINTRTTKLIIYLNNTYPNQNWGQYLNESNVLRWDKIILAGHSQGSGHACYLGKKKLVDRVVMFSGPNDYSNYYNSSANWLSAKGLTPLNKHFALLHTKDQIVSYESQVANLRGLGLLAPKENPVLVDNLTSPYGNSNALSLNIPANSYHGSTVGGNAILPNIWKYMFTSE